MDRDDQNQRQAHNRVADTQKQLARHERLTAVSLLILSVIAVLALGLLIAHIAGVSWLTHKP
jgi:hypothetical protein